MVVGLWCLMMMMLLLLVRGMTGRGLRGHGPDAEPTAAAAGRRVSRAVPADRRSCGRGGAGPLPPSLMRWCRLRRGHSRSRRRSAHVLPELVERELDPARRAGDAGQLDGHALGARRRAGEGEGHAGIGVGAEVLLLVFAVCPGTLRCCRLV